jgi:hypothetical protein
MIDPDPEKIQSQQRPILIFITFITKTKSWHPLTHSDRPLTLDDGQKNNMCIKNSFSSSHYCHMGLMALILRCMAGRMPDHNDKSFIENSQLWVWFGSNYYSLALDMCCHIPNQKKYSVQRWQSPCVHEDMHTRKAHKYISHSFISIK